MDFFNHTSVQELGHQATVVAVNNINFLAPVAGLAKLRVATIVAVAVPLTILLYRLLIDRKLVSLHTS